MKELFYENRRNDPISEAISVTSEQLKLQAKVCTQASQQIQDAASQGNSMNRKIASEWLGQACKSYLEQYTKVESPVKQMDMHLSSMNDPLVKSAATVAQCDQQDLILIKD